MSATTRGDDLIAAVAVVVLLIGTALNNAYFMLTTSVAALLVITVFRRERLGTGPILVALVAAITASVIGIAVTLMQQTPS